MPNALCADKQWQLPHEVAEDVLFVGVGLEGVCHPLDGVETVDAVSIVRQRHTTASMIAAVVR